MTRLIGCVHLAALPGSPRATTFESVRELARADAHALVQGGVDAIVIENFGDLPFRSGSVEPHTVACMTAIASELRREFGCEIGICVQRNDAAAALAIAMASDASFIRVNVHTGAMLTEVGIVTGRADDTLRLRQQLGAEHIRIYADVLVKHAHPLTPVSIAEASHDAVEFGLADAIIVSGTGTGAPATASDVQEAVDAVQVPVYVGSGITAANVCQYVPPAAGVIVGNWLKQDGRMANPVDAERVRTLRSTLNTRAR